MKTLKKMAAIAVVVLCTVTFMPVMPGMSGVVHAEGNVAKIVDGEEYPTVQAAIDAATTGQTVQMLTNSTENVEFQSAKTITLDLNGKVLCGKGTASVIKIPNSASGSKLTITDSNPDAEHMFIPATGERKAGLWTWDETNGTNDTEVVKGGIITGGNTSNGGGVYVNAGSSGALVLEGGSIVGCKAGSGGGVDTYSPFTMEGGAIIGCNGSGVSLRTDSNFTMTGGTISNCSGSANGGGILTSKKITISMSGNAKVTECEAPNGSGGGVYIDNINTQFTMFGNASISKCSASKSTSDSYGGGGVWIKGTMTLKDNASISECEASNGGGVLARSGTFNMAGGSISQCKIVKNESNAYKGGGVFVSEDSTQFIMTGGIIEKCEASVSGNYNTAGGGVCVKNGGSFIFSGGTISQCNTNNNGGGVYNDGTMKVSGTANISGNKKGTGESATDNNVYMTKGKTITVGTGSGSDVKYLERGAVIGVTLGATGGVGEVTGTNSNDYSDYFTADDAALCVYNDGNVVKIGVAVAEIVGGKKYTTVQAAIDAATSGQTVKMLADSKERMLFEGSNVTSKKAVTLDLNGHALIGLNKDEPSNNNNVIMLNTAKLELTIKDSEPNQEHYYTYNSSSAWTLNDTASEDAKKNAITLDKIDSKTTDGTLVLIPGGTITGGNRSNNGGGIYAASDAKLTINGINVVGNTSNSGKSGGGVYGNSSSTINCSNCNIVGNTAIGTTSGESTSGGTGGGIYTKGAVEITGSKIEYNQASFDGGALYVYGTSATATDTQFVGNSSARHGGAVYVTKGKPFDADKCTFSNNKATGVNGYGGALFINGDPENRSNVTITECAFENNNAYGSGGGIYNNYGTITITGGSYENNSAQYAGVIFNDNGKANITGGSYKNNSVTIAGGVIYNDGATLTITNGTFESNTASHDENETTGGFLHSRYANSSSSFVTITGATIKSNKAKNGGAIYNYNTSSSYTSKITITNCKITGNTANANGGGVYNKDSVIVSGATNITGNKKGTGDTATDNNVYLESGKVITIGTDELDAKASIGVTLESAPTVDNPVAVTGSNSADYHAYFVPDNTALVSYNDKTSETNQIVKFKIHTHSWTYEVTKTTTDNDTIKATCSGEGICSSTDLKLTIIKPTLTTYGETGKSAAATLSATKVGGVNVSANDIKYYKKNETTALTSAPTDAGTYKASITVGTGESAKTAYVEYTIDKAELTLSGISATAITYGDELSKSTITGTAKFGSTEVSGTWSWKTGTTKPAISDSEKTEYDVTFTPAATETNFKATGGKVKIKVNKQDYTGDKTATAKLKAKAGSTVEVTLPDIPEGASYGTPSSANAKVRSSTVTNKKITLTVDTTLVKGIDDDFKVTVPVTGANIYKDYNIEVTVTPAYKEVVTINATAENFTYGETGKTGYTGLSVTGNKVAVENLVKTYFKKGETTALAGQPTAVGEYKVVISVAETNEDYEGSKEVEFKINKAKVDVPAAEKNLVYNGLEQTGVKLPSDAVYTLSGNTGTNAKSDYSATATLKNKDNYEWKLATPTTDNQSIRWSIAKKSITVKSGITATDRAYKPDDKSVTLVTTNAVLEGKIDSDILTATATGTMKDAYAGKNKEVTISNLALGGTDKGNYKLADSGHQATTTVDISKAGLTLPDISATAITYGQTLADSTVSGTAKFGNDKVAGTWAWKTSSATKPKVSDSETTEYDVTFTPTSDNYKTTDGKVKIKVNKKQLEISGTTVANKTYDGKTEAKATAGTLDKKETDDTVNVSVKSAEFADKNAGEGKAVTVTYEISGADAGNYKAPVDDNSLKATISKKQLSISTESGKTTTAENKTYDGTTSATAHIGTVEGVVENDKVTVEIDSATFDNKNAGENKTVKVVYKMSGDDSSNYIKPANDSPKAKITPKAINVTADNKSSHVNEKLVELTYTADKLCAADSFTGALATDANKDKIGTYGITQGTLAINDGNDGKNYEITFNEGTYTVKKKAETPVAKEGFMATGTAKKASNTIRWNAVEGAEGYDIYYTKCGKSLKKIKTTTGLKYTKKKLNKKKVYKYCVKAYDVVNGAKQYIATTPTIHIAGSKAKYSNATRVAATPEAISMKAGENQAITAKVTKKNKKKTVLWRRHVTAPIRYRSSDASIATVDGNGRISAVNEGTTYIYAYAASGAFAKIEVKVQ